MKSFLITLKKVVVKGIIFGIPVILTILPSNVLNITLGGLLLIIYDQIKHRTPVGKILP